MGLAARQRKWKEKPDTKRFDLNNPSSHSLHNTCLSKLGPIKMTSVFATHGVQMPTERIASFTGRDSMLTVLVKMHYCWIKHTSANRSEHFIC